MQYTLNTQDEANQKSCYPMPQEKPSNGYTVTAEINATSIQYYYSRAYNVMAVLKTTV